MGFVSIFSGSFTLESFKRILCPMDPSRYYELPALVSKFEKIKKSKRVLDISSPKLITYYLASKYKNTMFDATDIQKKEIDSWKKSFGETENLSLSVVDARKMNYPDSTFDVVYSVSTIEHVLDDNKSNYYGDKKVVEEAYRVLKKGGVFIMTTMISSTGGTIYKGNNIYGLTGKLKNKSNYFFARVYSKEDLYKRLLSNTKFKLEHFEFCKYKSSLYEDLFNKFVPFSAVLGFLNIIFMPRLISIYKGINKDFGMRSDCLIVLKK